MKTYSPPARGIIAASSAYVSAPARLKQAANHPDGHHHARRADVARHHARLEEDAGPDDVANQDRDRGKQAQPAHEADLRRGADLEGAVTRMPLRSQVNRDDFVNVDGRNGERSDAVGRAAPPRPAAGGQQLHLPDAIAPAGRSNAGRAAGRRGITSRSGPFIIIGLVRLTR